MLRQHVELQHDVFLPACHGSGPYVSGRSVELTQISPSCSSCARSYFLDRFLEVRCHERVFSCRGARTIPGPETTSGDLGADDVCSSWSGGAASRGTRASGVYDHFRSGAKRPRHSTAPRGAAWLHCVCAYPRMRQIESNTARLVPARGTRVRILRSLWATRHCERVPALRLVFTTKYDPAVSE